MSDLKFVNKFLLGLFVLLNASFVLFQENKTIPNFSLKDTNNKIVSLENYKNSKGLIVIFTCNHCPFAKLYSKRLNELNAKYTAKGFPLIAINSMDTVVYEDETLANMKAKAKHDKFNFPYLFDANQSVGKLFNAEYTPQAFVLSNENNKWTVRYAGSIDNNGKEPTKAVPYVANAVEDILANVPVAIKETGSIGCRIRYRN